MKQNILNNIFVTFCQHVAESYQHCISLQLWRNALYQKWTHLLFSFSIFFNLFLSTSSWAWRRVFSCLKRLFWDSQEDIWILLARSSSVAARSLSAAAARRVWDSPNSKKQHGIEPFLNKHLEYEPFTYTSKLNLRIFLYAINLS